MNGRRTVPGPARVVTVRASARAASGRPSLAFYPTSTDCPALAYRNAAPARDTAYLTSSRAFRRGNPTIGFGQLKPFGSNPHSEGTGDTPGELSFVSLVGLWPGQ